MRNPTPSRHTTYSDPVIFGVIESIGRRKRERESETAAAGAGAAASNNTDKVSVGVPPFGATEHEEEDEEAKGGEGGGIDVAGGTATASEELPRPETRQATTTFAQYALSSNGAARDLLVPSAAPPAGVLTSRTSSASPRILTPARAALPRPQASVPHLLIGSDGGGGEGGGDGKEA